MINPMKPKHHRATEAQRTHFRVFRVFRGWLSFLLSSSVPPASSLQSTACCAVLALFAFLFAAAPAPAQSPAILLDIKSPATTSPPNETLLTLNDEGNLWIKGHLYDYAFQSTITLDPAKKYWTLRDSTGKIVWALEVHNPATGISTGDLYSIGSFEGWAAEPDQTGAILRYTNASAQAVFSLSAAGEARSNGTASQRGTPAPWPDPPALGAIPASSPDPPVIIAADYASQLNKIIPKPQAQGRILTNVPSPPPTDWSPYDVTGILWRRRWDSTKTTVQAYDVSLGCRYRKANDQSQWAYVPGDNNGVFPEQDAMVCKYSNNQYYLLYMQGGQPYGIESGDTILISPLIGGHNTHFPSLTGDTILISPLASIS